MSIGINKEEMLEAAQVMQGDRQLLSQLKPLIQKYRDKIEYARKTMQTYDNAEILYAQFRSKVKSYSEILADLESLVPVWLRDEIKEDML